MLCFEDRQAPFVEVFRRSADAAGYALELDAGDGGTAFDHFRSRYRHFSINPAPFELACFRRYFAMRGRLGPSERAILADSDLIVQRGPADLPAEMGDFGGLVGSIGVHDGVAEEDVSPHFSIWSGALLRDFCAYLIHVYSERSDMLADLYRRRAAARPRAAISDMTLIGLWCRETSVPLLDTNRLFGQAMIDHNISATHCANARFEATLGRKRLRFEGGCALFRTAQGMPIRPVAIHLQGRYKIAARAIAAQRRGLLAGLSCYVALGRAMRGFMQ